MLFEMSVTMAFLYIQTYTIVESRHLAAVIILKCIINAEKYFLSTQTFSYHKKLNVQLYEMTLNRSCKIALLYTCRSLMSFLKIQLGDIRQKIQSGQTVKFDYFRYLYLLFHIYIFCTRQIVQSYFIQYASYDFPIILSLSSVLISNQFCL